MLDQYIKDNGIRKRCGAGSFKPNAANKRALVAELKILMEKAVEDRLYSKAGRLQEELKELESQPASVEDNSGAVGSEHKSIDGEAEEDTDESTDRVESQTENETEEEMEEDADSDREDTHVLKLLHQGNVIEMEKRALQQSKAMIVAGRHDYHKRTKCTSIAQEESSALPAGVINVNEDSSGPDAFDGEDKDIAQETHRLAGL